MMSSNQDDIEWLRIAFMTPEQYKQHEGNKAHSEKGVKSCANCSQSLPVKP